MQLHTDSLVKKYRSRTVVDKVSIEVKQGEIVGLLGPNGAGKTTSFYMSNVQLEPVNAIQVCESLFKTSDHSYFAFAEPFPRVVVFLVWHIITFRVSDLSLEVIVVLAFVYTNTIPGCPLRVGIDVHFDHTV